MSTTMPPVPYQAPVLDPVGCISPTWQDFLRKLLNRVGQQVALSNTELAAKFPVQTVDIGDTQVTPAKIASSLAGAALAGGAGSALAVQVDNSTIHVSGNQLGIPDNGIPFVKLLSTDWTKSLATSGYQKLPSGLYIQWGVTASIASATNTAQTFPVAFPTACFQVIASISGNSAAVTTSTGQWGTGAYSTTGFTLNNRTTVANTFNWLAVGN